MTPPRGVTLAVLREALATAVGETSLRVVADQVGMTHSGLRTFLKSRRPHPGSIEKAVRWYASRAKRSVLSREDVETAKAVLRVYWSEVPVRAVRERRREEVRKDVLESRNEG